MSSDAKKQTDKIPDETGKTYYERTIDDRYRKCCRPPGYRSSAGRCDREACWQCPVIEVRGNLVRAWGDHFFLCVLLELSSLPGSGHPPTSIGAI